MRSFLLRVLKHGLVAAAALALAGWLAAQVAGAMVASDRDNGEAVAETLRARLPLGMAAWGFGVVVVIELFKSIWPTRKKPADVAATVELTHARPDPTDEAEKLLLQLLEQADAAEKARQGQPRPPTLPASAA